MQNNVFLRLAQERYTTKHYNGQQIPREEFDTLLEILRLTPLRSMLRRFITLRRPHRKPVNVCSPPFPNSTATVLPVRAMWWSLPYPRR